MARPVSVNVVEVAQRAKVSTASVSRVLNNRGGVSEKTRSKIRAILEDDGRFSAHVSERGAKLAVLAEMESPHFSTYMSSLISGVADYALHNSVDISTVFVSAREKAELDFLRLLRERRCDGVIVLLSKTVRAEELARLTEANMAVMVLGGECGNTRCGNMYTDPVAGMNLHLSHLTQLGHSHIAFLAGPMEGDSDNTQRATVFKRHHQTNGNRLGARLFAGHCPTRHAHEAGYLQAKDVLRRCPDVTAMIANNDEMAYGAMLACHEMGRSVPSDISVVGFDDSPGSQYTVPPLTTIDQHLTDIGFHSAHYLSEFACGSLDVLPRKTLKPELIVRGSTAQVRAS